MNAEIDALLEDEYAAQHEGEPHIHPVEVKMENDKRLETEVSALLIDISETLRLLNEQMIRLNEVTKTLPETVTALRTTTEAVQCISNELPAMVREQCLEEYRKILDNAVGNYNQMRKTVYKWQKSIAENYTENFKLITISALVTPILLLANLIFK